jgi:hypothetical protein
MRFSSNINAKLYILLESLLLHSLRFIRSQRSISKQIPKSHQLINSSEKFKDLGDISIVITTFEDRFFEFTIPLITNLRTEIKIPIFVIVNGNYYKKVDNYQLQEFIKALGDFTDIYPTAYSNFHGCAELWNTGIVNSDCENILIFNDDIHIYPRLFKQQIKSIKESISEHGLVTINRSFSHFGVSLKCIEEVGFFDEHFLGIGEEDRDYFFRYEIRYSKKPKNFYSEAFYHFGDEASEQEVLKTPGGKYSLFNTNIKEEFYNYDANGKINGRYEVPVKRVKNFIDPRPLWRFRRFNYKRLKIGD